MSAQTARRIAIYESRETFGPGQDSRHARFGTQRSLRDEGASSAHDPTSRLLRLARIVGVIAVYVGAGIIGFNPTGDPVLLSFPLAGHGIHLTDVLGLAATTVGIVLLWKSPRVPS
jgi:hypothetical protein